MDFEDEFATRDDEEVAIPRASLNKFIKDIIPDARLSNETRELLLNFCHEFIHHLSTKANIACTQANKKTINPEHILNGLDAMGLSTYKDEAQAANEGAKVELKDRRMLKASYKFKQHDNEQLEQLMEEQQKMFEQARATFMEAEMDRDVLITAAASLNNGDPAVHNIATSAEGSATNLAASSSSLPSRLLCDLPTAALSDEDNYD